MKGSIIERSRTRLPELTMDGAITLSDVAAPFSIGGVTAFAPIVIRMASDQTFTQSNTTLQNVTELVFAVAANEVWHVRTLLIGDSGTIPDIKVGMTVPTSATFDGRVAGTDAAGGASDTGLIETGTFTGFGAGAGTPYCFGGFYGILINSTTAGNFQVQASQNTSDASNTKLLRNSCIIAHRLV